MPRVERIVFVAETPWERKETRSMVDALDWVEQQVVDNGTLDGFEVTLTLEVLERGPVDDARG